MKSGPVYVEDDREDYSPDTKLTDWEKEPSILDLKNDFQMTISTHTAHVTKVRNWLDLRNTAGKHKVKERDNRSSVQPKMIRKHAEWRYSALSEPFLSSEKMFDVSPTTWEDKNAAEQNEQVLNWQFRTKINPVDFIDKYVRTVTDEGTCYLKTGWKRHTKMEMVSVPIWSFRLNQDPEYVQILQQTIALMTENPQGFSELPEEVQEAASYAAETGTPVTAEITGYTEEEQEVVLKNEPTAEIIDYENVYLDPTCEGDVSKAHFAVITFQTSKGELLKDGRYKNLKKVNWSSNTPQMDEHHSSTTTDDSQFRDDLRKPVVAYEYWGFYDVKGNNELVPIVATWIGDTLIRMEENPFPDEEIPLILVPYMPVLRSATGEPDAELLEDNQKISGAVTRGMVDLMARSANGQTGFAKGMLDAVNRRKYEQGRDYEFNQNAHPTMSVHTHKYPEIPASALNMLALQNQEAEAMTGVKSFSGGMSGEAYGDVAAGIRGMIDAAAKREMSILRRLAAGMEQLGRKFISMNQVFMSDEETVEVTNKEFVKISRKDLKGEFNLKVDISTAEIEEAKAQDLGFMLQTLGNTLPFELTKTILVQIAKLKRMPTLAHELQNYQPQPDPVEQAMKELEVAEIQAKISEIRSKTLLNEAKARAEASNADMKDLDFLEQESGTKHMRDIDRQHAQAEAQQLANITKSVVAAPDKRPTDESLMTALGIHQAAKDTV